MNLMSHELGIISTGYCDVCGDLDKALTFAPILKFRKIKRGFWKRTRIVLSLTRSYFFPHPDLEKIRINLWGSIKRIANASRYDFTDDFYDFMPVHPNCRSELIIMDLDKEV